MWYGDIDDSPRNKILDVSHSFLDIDNVRIIWLLLSEMKVTIRINDAMSTPLNKGTRCRRYSSLCTSKQLQMRRCLPSRLPAGHNLPSEAVYAGDADFISTDHDYLSKVNAIAPTALGDWLLYVNVNKTAHIIISRETDCDAKNGGRPRNLDPCSETLRTCLAESRRKMLAVTAFHSMWYLWLQRQHVSEQLRLRLNNAFVRPVLLYNAGAWGLTGPETEKLDETTSMTHRDSLATEVKQREVV